jgi:hypothetical protein
MVRGCGKAALKERKVVFYLFSTAPIVCIKGKARASGMLSGAFRSLERF